MIWLVMIACGLLTFATRFVMFSGLAPRRLPDWLEDALGFVPIAVLTAIIVPAMLMPGGEGLELTLSNAYLVGGVVAVLIAAFSRNLLLTIFGSMLVFFLWRWWLFG